MIIKATRHEGDKTYFDKSVIFSSTKKSYVYDCLVIGSIYDIKQLPDGSYENPSKANKIK